MCHFEPSKDPDAALIVRKDVCLFNHTVNYRCCISLQRLFQRKDLSFQLLPELVVLRDDQFNKLRDSHELVLESIKHKLLTYTLKKFVLSEMDKHPDDERWNLYDGETPAGVEELTDVLCKQLTDFISNNLLVFVKKNCDFCRCGFPVPHNCMIVPRIPTVYKLRDLNNNDIEGTFYEKEMQKGADSGYYPVEKGIKKRRRKGKIEYFVKFQGYPDEFNSWVSEVKML
ncbi:hypothetical protein AVEN_110143-1 [Araneus ventricosus]|uniref:Chromo domain-containing protein n=1 Tax=Araneus ventricosus TaxID=182803 RepID=A0A4Y2J1G2_ARAVE|nr:hypothetical protein AVEN_110143-1 [Araneus ventricosus]